MRIQLGAMIILILSMVCLSEVAASPLMRLNPKAAQNTVADKFELVHHKAGHDVKNRGRHYGWVRGKHKGKDKRDRDRPRCMIEPWLCR